MPRWSPVSTHNAHMRLYPRPDLTHPSRASRDAGGALFVARTLTLDREIPTLVVAQNVITTILGVPKGGALLTRLPTADASRISARRSPRPATVCACGVQPITLERSQPPGDLRDSFNPRASHDTGGAPVRCSDTHPRSKTLFGPPSVPFLKTGPNPATGCASYAPFVFLEHRQAS
ncbi:hypothetical protein RhiJN_25257 [Ceratobasidium sp. AG-Ba]|nr:hypothetical protein RhiJN_25257 [Ceratobasidium sp. AG-Ba]